MEKSSNILKIDFEKLPELISRHIFELSEAELNALAFILDAEISKYFKNDHRVEFKIKNSLSIAFVECFYNGNISMGKSNKVKNGLSGLVSWGGVFSFADMMITYRTFISKSYEITMQSPKKLAVYSLEEWQLVWCYAFDLIFSKKGGAVS